MHVVGRTPLSHPSLTRKSRHTWQPSVGGRKADEQTREQTLAKKGGQNGGLAMHGPRTAVGCETQNATNRVLQPLV